MPMSNRNKVERCRFLIFQSLRAAAYYNGLCFRKALSDVHSSFPTFDCWPLVFLHLSASHPPIHPSFTSFTSSSTLLPLVTPTMVANGNRRVVLAVTAALLFSCCSFTPSTTPVVMAQVTPTPVEDFAWVRSGPNLVIEGGAVYLNNVVQFTSSQTFALDLSVSWPVTAAPWRALTNGTANAASYGVGSPNNQTILLFQVGAPAGSLSITTYDTVAKTWSSPLYVTNIPDLLQYGQQPVMVPTSGLIYIAGTNNMNAFDTVTQTWTVLGPIASTMLTARPDATPVYNPARRTIMYVGGYDYAVSTIHFDPVVVVTEYAPATNKWSVMVR